MWTTLLSFCKSRYADNDLRAQAESMTPETRQSLTEKIVQTLNEGGVDEEDGSENVETLLDKIKDDLEVANQQLASLEEKEEFLATRIHKYASVLKQQGDHLNQSNLSTASYEDEDQLSAEQQHYQEQLEKQQKHKVALGKVVDVHMDILKSIKDCKRTIATLEKKEYELKNVTKKCREFLVLAEEAEREQQLGIENEDMEMAPMMEPEADRRQAVEEKSDPTSSRTVEDDLNDEDVDEQTGRESAGLLIQEKDSSGEFESEGEKSGVPSYVEPLELTA